EPVEYVFERVLIDPRMGRVGGDHPQPFDLAAQNAFDNLVIRPTIAVGDAFDGKVKLLGDLLAMLGILKIMPAEQTGRVAKEPRAHRVALAGDRVGSRPRPADVAGHQSEIDETLCGPHALITLVDAHRPPERNAAAF